jgi:hypothetical protein
LLAGAGLTRINQAAILLIKIKLFIFTRVKLEVTKTGIKNEL